MTKWFDFDEWAALYQRNPAAFEARRQAVLALELARATPAGAARAKAALRQLESQMADCGDAQRIQTALTWMAASMGELSDSLQALVGAITAEGRQPASPLRRASSTNSPEWSSAARP